MRAFLLLFLFSFALLACRQKLKGTPELMTMDSLLVALDKTNNALDSIDFKGYEEIKAKVKQEVLWIQEHVKDTLNREQSILISNYARIIGKRGLGTAVKQNNDEKSEADSEYDNQRKSFIRKEIELCIKQLENLKYDTENKKLTEEQVVKYLNLEKTNAGKIITYVAIEKSKSFNAKMISDSLGPQIAHFIDSLKMNP